MQTIKYLKQYWIGNYKYLLPLAIFTFLFLFLFSKLSPFYPINDWSDASMYLILGKALFQGKTLYTDIFDPKGPLIFFLYGISSLFKPLPLLLLFFFQYFFWFIALISIFELGKKLMLPDINSFIIAMLILPFTINFMHMGGSPEEFILLANIVSLNLFVSYFKENQYNHNPKYMFVHGLTSAFILFLKYNLTIFILLLLISLTINIIKNEGIKALFKNIVYYLCGFSTIALPILIYFLNNANLADAFDSYFLLTKKLAIRIPIKEVIINGLTRLYLFFKSYTLSFFCLIMGTFISPSLFFKNIIGRIGLYLAILGSIGMAFFAGVYHFYYPLPLFTIIALGLLSLNAILKKSLSFNYSKPLIIFLITGCLLVGYNDTHFFDLGFKAIVTRKQTSGVHYYFAKTIGKEAHPTLLNLHYGATTSIYTILNIDPNVKYFTALNIAHEVYPILKESQLNYIKEKKCQFVIVREDNEFFTKSHELLNNYDLIDSYDEYLLYLKPPVRETFLLYKAKP